MRHFFSVFIICLSFLSSGCDQSSSEKKASGTEVRTPITNPYLSAEGEHITLKADNLTQHQILTFMSTQLAFEAKLTAPLDKTISVNLAGVTLREALQTVLSGNPYSVTLLYQSQVDFFPKLITITLEDKSALPLIVQPSLEPQNSVPFATPITAPSLGDNDAQLGMKQFQDTLLANNPPTAADPPFLEAMTGTKEDVIKVTPMLQDSNISSDDKIAIINMLQEGEHDDVIEPLQTALTNKDPEVVKAAIEAIVFLSNTADTDTLKKLRDTTKDADIRQAADDGITFLE